MPNASLFRPEATVFRQESSRSGDALPTAPPGTALTWLLALLLCTALVFLATGSYARKETASGYLAPTLGVSRVFPPHPGTVIALDVVEGQVVVQGTPLLTVQVGQSDGQGSDVDGAVLQALSRQRDALLEQIELEQTRTDAEQRRVRDRLGALASETTAQRNEMAVQRARMQVAEEQVTAIRDLVAKGFVSVVEFKRRQDNFLLQRQSEAVLARQIAETLSEATQQRHTIDELPGELSRKRSVLRAAVAALDERLSETAGRQSYLLRAPISGRISALQARVGLVADATIPLLAIVPTESVLEAQLLVPARAIGFIAPGQQVNLAYEAFPFQRFGLHGGHVLTVSSTLLRPAELVGPAVIGDASYRVTVKLDRQSVAALGRDFPLGPDMTLRAEIVLDRRSLLQWVFEPMLSLKGSWL